MAGKLLAPESGRGEQLEALAQEYLGQHPEEADDRGSTSVESFRRMEDRRRRREAYLAETQRWWTLPRVANAAVPPAALEDGASAQEIDAELRRLVSMRSGWDASLGHAAQSVKTSGLWKLLGFDSFSHWAAERMGLAKRTAEQRVAVERRLWEVPALRRRSTRSGSRTSRCESSPAWPTRRSPGGFPGRRS